MKDVERLYAICTSCIHGTIPTRRDRREHWSAVCIFFAINEDDPSQASIIKAHRCLPLPLTLRDEYLDLIHRSRKRFTPSPSRNLTRSRTSPTLLNPTFIQNLQGPCKKKQVTSSRSGHPLHPCSPPPTPKRSVPLSNLPLHTPTVSPAPPAPPTHFIHPSHGCIYTRPADLQRLQPSPNV